ncbi:MAG: Gfo/Idh/MocA family protein [Chitinophagaceae bacterium]
MNSVPDISFSTDIPTKLHKIYMIGAGGIVHDAHLPAYRLAKFSVAGIYDPAVEKAQALAEKYTIPQVFFSLEELVKEAGTSGVYDIAVPGNAISSVLKSLPDEAAVLIQKPMGENMEQAKEIHRICREKKLLAAVNFQLRYAPAVNGLKSLLQTGALGEITDLEIYLNVHMPWENWHFLEGIPRVEILYHSIHYIDLIRSLLGEPSGMVARTWKHPDMRELASVKTNIVMEYGDLLRAAIHTNHTHYFGDREQEAYLKLEGTGGAVKIGLGFLVNYPGTSPDTFLYQLKKDNKPGEWVALNPGGAWFPHAFIGPMAQVMRAKEGCIAAPENAVEDVLHTMACVEAAYVSCTEKGVSPRNFL